MTFLIGDTQIDRHAKIRSLVASGEFVIAVLLAAADFEWTVRRAILALGTSPNADIRAVIFKDCSGLAKYKSAWKDEVVPRLGKGLPEVVPDWQHLQDAFELRHRLIHGVIRTTGAEYTKLRVERMLRSSAALANFSNAHAVDLFARIPVRRRR